MQRQMNTISLLAYTDPHIHCFSSLSSSAPWKLPISLFFPSFPLRDSLPNLQNFFLFFLQGPHTGTRERKRGRSAWVGVAWASRSRVPSGRVRGVGFDEDSDLCGDLFLEGLFVFLETRKQGRNYEAPVLFVAQRKGQADCLHKKKEQQKERTKERKMTERKNQRAREREKAKALQHELRPGPRKSKRMVGFGYRSRNTQRDGEANGNFHRRVFGRGWLAACGRDCSKKVSVS